MNDIIASIAIFSFVVFPPALLILKFITKKPGWWITTLLIVLFALLGWGLVFTAFVEEQNRISELIHQERYDELLEGWDSDGASGVFALFAGWVVPLAYFMLWLVIYTMASMVRGFFTSRQPPNKRMESDAAEPRR